MFEFTPESFALKVLQEKTITLVNFWAGWCAPCALQEPIIRKLAQEYGDKALVGRVNVDDHPALADQYQVLTIPTTIVFAEGNLVETLIGFQADEYLRAYLDHLTKPA